MITKNTKLLMLEDDNPKPYIICPKGCKQIVSVATKDKILPKKRLGVLSIITDKLVTEKILIKK